MINLHHEAENMGIDASRLPTHPQLGKFYRLPVIGKPNSDKSSSIKLLAEGVAYLRNFITGESKTVFDDDLPTNPKAIADRKRAIKLAQQQAQKELNDSYYQASIKALATWQNAKAVQSHPYTNRKRLQPLGLRQDGYDLIIPVYSFATGKIASLQRIKPNGEKQFMAGGKVSGGFFTDRKRQENERIIISEGWATSQSLAQQWQAKGWHIACFNAGNMPKLAQLVRQRYPQAQIILAADNDQSGTGQAKAKEASLLINGVIALPNFTPKEREQFSKVSDWHDRFMLDQMQVKGVNDAI